MGTEVLSLKRNSFSLSPLLFFPHLPLQVFFLQFDNSSGAAAFLYYYLILLVDTPVYISLLQSNKEENKPVCDLISHGCF